MSIITPFPISKHEALCLFSGAKLDTDITHGPGWIRVSGWVENLKIGVPWHSSFGRDVYVHVQKDEAGLLKVKFLSHLLCTKCKMQQNSRTCLLYTRL